jgi:flavin reductase (DIM6/NTAB) family NADH-FMN oxidoreductase RutF
MGDSAPAGLLAVNILGHQHRELAARIAGPADRFAGLRTLPTDHGMPVQADALAVLVCDVRDEHPAGDHTVVLGQVRAVHTLRDGAGLDTVSLRLGTPDTCGCREPWHGR